MGCPDFIKLSPQLTCPGRTLAHDGWYHNKQLDCHLWNYLIGDDGRLHGPDGSDQQFHGDLWLKGTTHLIARFVDGVLQEVLPWTIPEWHPGFRQGCELDDRLATAQDALLAQADDLRRAFHEGVLDELGHRANG